VKVFLSEPDQYGGSYYMAHPNIEYKNGTTNRMNFEEDSRLELASAHEFLPSDWGCSVS